MPTTAELLALAPAAVPVAPMVCLVAQFSAVLFDLDGVLISTDNGVLALWRDVLAGHGIRVPADELRVHAIGCSREHTIEHFLGDHPAEFRAAVLADVTAAEASLQFELVPGAAALIAALDKAGVPMGCVTGASVGRLSRALSALGARALIATSVVWGDVEHGKPAPDSYVLAAERLRLPPSQCLVIEDSVGGVLSAAGAGCSCIALAAHDDAEALDAAGATVVVESLLSLTLSAAYDGGHVISTDEGDFYFPPAATQLEDAGDS
ncbi:MAG: hypothetical protein QOC60_271 [Frankiaceae bacterium]|nr:hypothetical protein [Frankiaceae bacterium]